MTRAIVAECEGCGALVTYPAKLVNWYTYANGEEYLTWNDDVSGRIAEAVTCECRGRGKYAMRRPQSRTAEAGG